MHDPIETFTHNGREIHILPDQMPCNPREEFEYSSILYCRNLREEGPADWPDAKTHIVLPVFRYEHSGTALNTTGFNCPWDSGLTGYIAEKKSDIRKEFSVNRISPHIRSIVENRLKSEVAEFSKYVNGEVYGYVIPELDDSCWGFIGLDWCIEAAKEAAA